MTTSVSDVIDTHLESYKQSLFELLHQPTISTTGGDLTEEAATIADFIASHGFDESRLIKSDHNPLVYAESMTNSKNPTVVFYGHYDVQPIGDELAWKSPPFEPTVRDGRIYARGSADNKGQFAAHVFAIDALQAAGAMPAVNVKLLIEGGEEGGDQGLYEYLESDGRDIADADVIYISDGSMHRTGHPTIIYGHRGIIGIQLDHKTAKTDLHSGSYGGPVPNAANELVEVIDSLQVNGGEEIAVDDFYADIEVSEADRELVGTIPVDKEAIAEELGLSRFASREPYYERLLLEPTMSIEGMGGGHRGEGRRAIIPHEATATLDFRLIPDQDPDAIFELIQAHVHAVNPDVEVTNLGGYPPMKTSPDVPVADSVIEALSTVWADEVVEIPLLGGSLPGSYFRMVDGLSEVPVLIVPYGNSDQNNHAPNENLTLKCFENGIRTTAEFVQRFADSP